MNRSLSSEIRPAELRGHSFTVKNVIALEVHWPIFFSFFFGKMFDYSNPIATDWYDARFQLAFCLFHARAAVTGDLVFHPHFSGINSVFCCTLAEPTLQRRSQEERFSNSKCCFLLGNWELHVLVISASRNIWVGDLFFWSLPKRFHLIMFVRGKK